MEATKKRKIRSGEEFDHLFPKPLFLDPTIKKGANIKYSIPEFKPWAGFSPNCCAVFVHMEHCANVVICNRSIKQKKNNFFIKQK